MNLFHAFVEGTENVNSVKGSQAARSKYDMKCGSIFINCGESGLNCFGFRASALVLLFILHERIWNAPYSHLCPPSL